MRRKLSVIGAGNVGATLAQRLAEAELGDNEQARYFIEFVRSSKRGVCR